MKRLLSLFLVLAMVFGMMPTTIFAEEAETAQASDLGSVRVIVENNTCPADDLNNWTEGSQPWTGTRLDTWVPLKADSTMMSCLVDALGREHTQTGAETGMITEVDGLDSATGGWMGSINDWYANEGFDAFTVASGTLESGDEIRISYTMLWGSDLGSIAKDTTKTLRSLEISGGTLAQTFVSNQYTYQIELGEGVTSGTLQFVPTAYNKNFQVRTYKGETYSSADKGYKRSASIPVNVGDQIQIVVGDPAWPSMNNGAYGGAEAVPAGVYTFDVVEQNAAPDTNVDSFFTGLDGVATVENTKKYPLMVNEDGTALVTTNAGQDNSESGVTLTFQKTAELHFQFKTDCESKWDFVKISLNGNALNSNYNDRADFSGKMEDFKPYSLQVTAGDVLEVVFAKDTGGQSGKDCAWFKDFTVSMPYSVTFHANDGSEVTEEQGIFGTAALNANTFTREGYRFDGWAESAEGPVAYEDGAQITLTENKDLYAVWTAVWPVTFPNMPEGAAITVKQGDAVVQPQEDGSYLLSDGSYTYSASLFGYTAKTDVQFKVSGAALAVQDTLEKKASYDVTFAVTPEEAKNAAVITVLNSEGTEMTAQEGVYNLPAGEYTYTVKASGFKKVSGKFTVSNEVVSVDVPMEISIVWDGSVAQSAPSQSGGVYQIGTGEELAWFAQQVNNGENVSAVLTADIQLNVPEETPVNEWVPIGTKDKPFAGSFNGAGHSISGLYIKSGNNIGLFGAVAAQGSVSDLTITGADIHGTGYVGLAAGLNEGSVSGIMAESSAVTGKQNVGGIVGENSGTVAACANRSAVVTQDIYNDNGIGGIVGLNSGTVSMCYNLTDLVRGHNNKNYAYFGGIVGNNAGTVDSCYNTGLIPAAYKAGGIVGNPRTGEIRNCYNTGTIEKGGICAICGGSSNVKNCFYLDTCGATDTRSTAMTEAELKQAADQMGGAFQMDLTPNVNNGFPILKWQDPNATYTITLTVTPADAEVTLTSGGETVAPASSAEGVYTYTELQPGEYTYTVTQEAKDCQPQTGRIFVSNVDVHKDIDLQVRTYPVVITMAPADASVVVKNSASEVMTGATDAEAGTVTYQLPNGTYTYEAEKFGYISQSGSFDVNKAGVNQTLTLELSKNQSFTFTGVPEGTVITVMHPVGGLQTPDENGVYHLVDGDFTYTAVKEGYVNLSGTITMAGSDQTLKLDMHAPAAWTGAVAEGFAVGSGSKEDPYQISSPEELAFLSAAFGGEQRDQYNGKCFKVVNDLNMGESVPFTPVGTDYGTCFGGTFDGNGKVISNLYVEVTGSYAGLFGYVRNADLKNVVLKNAIVTATEEYAGALWGYDDYTSNTVDHCSVLGAQVMANSQAGIMGGYSNSTTVSNSYASGDVVAMDTMAGGICGYGSNLEVANSYVRGSVTAADYAGGIYGKDPGNGVMIRNVYAYADVTCENGSNYGAVASGNSNYNSEFENTYYCTDAQITGSRKAYTHRDIVGKTDAEMKSDEFLALLNADGDNFARLQSESAYANDGLPYVPGTYVTIVNLEKLPVPAGLAWKDKTVSWQAVANASSYRVTLYKGEDQIAQIETKETSADFAGQIGIAGSGSYTATVQAMGDRTTYGSSEVSPRSDAVEFTISGAEVTFAVTAGTGSFAGDDPRIIVKIGSVEQQLINNTAKFLPAGTHTYTIEADSFRTISGTVTVDTQAQTIEATMEFDPVWNGTTAMEPELVDDVYQISNGYELAWFRDQVNETMEGNRSSKLNAVLTADIDLGGHAWKAIGPFTSTSERFGYTGTFDGAGHSISGLYVNDTTRGNGLFGYVYVGGTVKNVTVSGSVTSPDQYNAGVVAILAGGRIENCTNHADVAVGQNNYAGGVCGYMTNYSAKSSVVTGCRNTGKVSGKNFVGGIVGNASDGTDVTNCRNSGAISGTENVGGVVGSSSLPISGCSNTGVITGAKGKIAGIVGFTNKNITECYNTGAVNGSSTGAGSKYPYGVGGIVGDIYKKVTEISKCYNTGVITDTGDGLTGAIVGSKSDSAAAVNECYYLEGTSANGIGLNAVEGDSTVALSAAAMNSKTMAGRLGGHYAAPVSGGSPVLSWEDSEAQLVTAFEVVPADAEITVTAEGDSAAIPSAEKNVWVLADGTYTYTISRENYDPAEGTVTVAGESQLVKVTMKEQTFPVTFNVEPADAQITVLNAAGETMSADETGYNLPDGDYTYTVSKFGYVPKSGSFKVEHAAVEIPAITLETAVAYAVTLKITYAGETPADAVITVKCGEETVGSTAQLNLPDGDYTYSIVASGYFTAEGTFQVSGNAVTVPVTVELRSTWDGTTKTKPALAGDVYQISSAEELAWFADAVNGGQTAINGKLLTNIFVNDENSSNTWTSIGDYKNQYSGTFDGNNKAVRGLDKALFGYGGEGGLIKNVTVTGDITGTSNSGAICTATYGSIEGCRNEASVTANGQRVGGIVGVIYDGGHITNCANYGRVESSYNGTEYTESGAVYLGGIIGYAYVPVTGCANYGEVVGSGSNYGGIGGVVGVADNTVTSCYNLGNVTGVKRTGGLVGIADQQGSAVTGGYNAGKITCTGTSNNPFCGAIVGDAANADGATVGAVTKTYYLENTYKYGGQNQGIGYGTGETTVKTEAEMKSDAFVTTLGADFRVDDPETQNGYPVLAWQGGRAPAAGQDAQDVAADKQALTVEPTTVTKVMTLKLAAKGTNGSDITWSSSNPDIISDAGAVTLPAQGTEDVVLTATITKGSASDTRSFTITVQSELFTAQKTLETVLTTLGNVNLKPQFGRDTNIVTVFRNVLEQKIEENELSVQASDIEVTLINSGFNNHGSDTTDHIADDGTITFYYVDPAKDTMHGSPMRDIVLRMSYKGASIDCTASAFIPWDRDRVKQEMKKIADALTFDLIKGENTDASAVSSDLTLPGVVQEYGWATITWVSNNEVIKVKPGATVLENSVGKIYPVETDTPVKLSAVISFNKTSDSELALNITKDLNLTVAGAASKVEEELQAALDKYTVDKLTDMKTGQKIDIDAVCGDIKLAKPRDLGVDGSKIRVEVISSNDSVGVNSYRANVYRPLPGEADATSTLTVKLTHKESGKFVQKELCTITIKPLEQAAIDAELALMERVKANLFEGMKGKNTDAKHVTTDLHTFLEVYQKDNDLVWVYNFMDETGNGIKPMDLPKDSYNEFYNKFHSSAPNVIKHENLLVYPAEKNTNIVITMNLGSQDFTRYAERYPDHAQLQKLANQLMTLEVRVPGTSADQVAANEVWELIDAIGTVTLDSEQKITEAREAYEALTPAQQELVDNLGELESAEKTLENLKQPKPDVQKIYRETGDMLEGKEMIGDWEALGLARSGRAVPNTYYDSVVKYVKKNANSQEQLRKATDSARTILALTAIGKDVTNVGGHNLLKGLSDMKFVTAQGVNGPAFALIALDSHQYEIPENQDPARQVTRDQLIDYILQAQNSDGGWNLRDDAADVDMTAMVLQALAPYYQTRADVQAAVDQALNLLSQMQNSDGGFGSVDAASSESIAQVLTALTALGIDPDSDARFVKDGNTVVNALCGFAVDGGGFKHTASGAINGLATQQAYYALTAYYRFTEGKTSLYDMSDVNIEATEPEKPDPEKPDPEKPDPEKPEHTHNCTWTVVRLPSDGKPGEMVGVCDCGETVKKMIPTTGTGRFIVQSDADNSCQTKLVGDDVIYYVTLTQEEQEAYIGGADVTITLHAADISDTIADDAKAAVSSKVPDSNVGLYLDITMDKTVGSGSRTPVSEISGKVKISLVVPENLRTEGRAYQIVCVYNGQASVIDCEYDETTGMLTFDADRFSTYALSYSKAPADPENPTKPETKPQDPTKPETKPQKPTKPGKQPNTGDDSNAVLFAVLAVFSLTGLTALAGWDYLSNRRKSHRK